MIRLSGRHGYHVTPHRSPPIRHFERIADAADFDALNVIEALTDDRIRDEIGQIEVAPAHERLYGTHAELVMAAFAHWNAEGSPFSDGSYGVFLFGLDEMTATIQASHHIEAFLATTNEQPTKVQMALYSFRLAGEVADLRAMGPVSCVSATYETGKRLRATGIAGVMFSSPSHHSGECVAAFKATVIADYLDATPLEFHWNGERIDKVSRMNPDKTGSRKL